MVVKLPLFKLYVAIGPLYLSYSSCKTQHNIHSSIYHEHQEGETQRTESHQGVYIDFALLFLADFDMSDCLRRKIGERYKADED